MLKPSILFVAITILSSCYSGKNEQLIYKVRSILKENHPGFYNELDPNFLKKEESCFSSANGDPYKYIKCFDDGHLFLRRNNKQVNNCVSCAKNSEFEHKIDNDVVYLKIPTFQMSKETSTEIDKLVDIVNQNPNKEIVIDIRNNGGGANDVYQKILKTIFGLDYYNEKMKKYYTNSYIDFRSTLSNVKHLETRFGYNKNGFYGKTLDKCLEDKKDMCTVKTGNGIKVSKKLIKNKFNKNMYVLINNRNGSASLNFLDELMILYKDKTILVGEETGSDTLYMNLHTEAINDVVLGFPMQVMRNRLRGEGGYVPNIRIKNDKIDTCLKSISSFNECIKTINHE